MEQEFGLGARLQRASHAESTSASRTMLGVRGHRRDNSILTLRRSRSEQEEPNVSISTVDGTP
jgi:hypothetical protein